uniref:DUF4758 domain-containing protein n=2 Tax=Zeugodacus cucurbitae TaxID=28588 RepID=A0A0A1WYX8_ZEUCU
MLHLRRRCGSMHIRARWPRQQAKMSNHELSHFPAKASPTTHRISSCKTLTVRSILLFLLVTMLLVPAALTQTAVIDELYIKPTPALHMIKEDLTTVVLVNNAANNGRSDFVGHHLNIRSEVGLLTSTARTFIQEGVTTEYATQVVGTTLDSGRLYAQYLRKSSRVLYNNGQKPPQQTQQAFVLPTVVTSWVGDNLELQTKSLLESHNDLFNADLPDWQDIDDRLLHTDGNVFVGNTDVASQTSSRKQQQQQPPLNDERILQNLAITTVLPQTVANDERSNVVGGSESKQLKVGANKVLPIGDLATYTVRNHFSPSGLPTETVSEPAADTNVKNPNRSPKLYYQQLMATNSGGSTLRNSPFNRQLSTTTYYGFADFTTIVGDSVIVFSPSTATQPMNLGHVTSIMGEATLAGLGDNVQATVGAIPVAMATEVQQTQEINNVATLITDVQANMATRINLIDISSETQSEEPVENSDVDDKNLADVTESNDSRNIIAITDESLSVIADTVIAVEQTLSVKPTYSRPSEQEIAEIYASLARAAAARERIATTILVDAPTMPIDAAPMQVDAATMEIDAPTMQVDASKNAPADTLLKHAEGTSAHPILENNTVQFVANGVALLQSSEVKQPETTNNLLELTSTSTTSELQILGGATTVFYEDDPFANFVESFTSVTKATDMLYAANSTLTTQPAYDMTSSSGVQATTEEAEDNVETTTAEYKAETAQTLQENVDDDVKMAVKEINADNADIAELSDCIRTSQVFLTQIAKTITQLNTLRDTDAVEAIYATKDETVLLPTFDIIETTKVYCIKPQATAIVGVPSASNENWHEKAEDMVQLEKPQLKETKLHESAAGDNVDGVDTDDSVTTTADMNDEENLEHTTKIAEADSVNNNSNNNDNDSEVTDEYVDSVLNADDASGDDDSGEEIELIYKTLYTTYTYLTTFFNEDSSTSISSHTEVLTNIVTSTLAVGNVETTPATVTNQVLSTATAVEAQNEHEISSSSKFILSTELESILRVDEHDMQNGKTDDVALAHTATALLDDSKLVKTYFTTYTYYTTIFAEGETEIMSRTEVYTNYVTTDMIMPTAVAEQQSETVTNFINNNAAQASDTNNADAFAITQAKENANDQLSHSTMSLDATPVFANEQLGFDNYKDVTLVTDIRSSSSNGQKHIINQQQEAFSDQISSESNTDEIRPSAILLLQTSYTTFTYYTTMYNNDATNVISRLETITNVVTETLQPTKTESVDEVTLPITYFTTFTYWTKLAKNGEITTLSREETISNVITPSTITQTRIQTADEPLLGNEHMLDSTLSGDEHILESTVSRDDLESTQSTQTNTVLVNNDNIAAVVDPAVAANGIADNADATALLEPTTYYTTYTYYTTSYDADRTITDSRYETVTHVVTPTRVANKTVANDINERATAALKEVLSNVITPVIEKSPSALFYDYKRIIDAEGVSTLHYLTEILPTTATDGMQTNFTSSTSSLQVDELKKATQSSSIATANADNSAGRQYKTGLVRLIEGTRIGNHTTTLYQSKVIGTFIENRYAQIIESTSSFIFETNTSPLATDAVIEPTLILQVQDQLEATALNAAAAPVLQNSIVDSTADTPALNDNGKEDEENFDGDAGNEDEDGEDDGDGSNKGRLAYQSKKRTFTPVIRPFASRNRPQFAPKKKNSVLSSATIITRHDFTPTITATPALKSSGRFSTRKGASASNAGVSGALPNSSSRRPFGRPIKPTASGGNSFASNTPALGSGSGYSGGRNRLTSSARLQSSSRRAGVLVRPSSVSGARPGFSSAYAGNSRIRIKPTGLPQPGQQNTPAAEGVTIATSETSAEESTTPELQTSFDENDEGGADAARRNQNPLLRLRRPLNRPAGFTPASQRAVNGGAGIVTGGAVSQRRNPLISRAAKSTTTFASTTTTTQAPRARSLQRPQLNNALGRTRPQNSLFPPRGLLQRQINQETNENKKDDSTEGNADNDDDSEYDDEDEEDNEDDTDGDNNRRRRSNSKQNSNKKLTLALEKPLTTDNAEIKALHKNKSSRVRREAEKPRSSFRNRFRRPKLASAATTTEDRNSKEESESEAPAPVTTAVPRARTGGRFAPRYNLHHTSTQVVTAPATTTSTGNHRTIRPTRPTNGRAQFTLREKDTTTTTQKGLTRPGTSHFRRPQTAASSRRSSAPTTSNRRKSYNNNNGNLSQDTAVRSTSSRTRTNLSRTRTTVRGRSRNEYNADPVVIPFDGTITITHVIPAEVTIPVINGQVTEYKNVVTAKTSTEILSPQQYTSFVGSNGQTMLALTREDSSVNFGGATEITQYVLHESPTTTVIFTPTTIRGRKTSFSHVIPSTVYSVENVISTTQPQIASNAPLANILLSQLLLGNIGLPAANPLLGALGAAATPAPNPLGVASILPQVPATPVTEYRTHSSTYVTTVFEGMSTVLPITFQGKKILTTVYDTTAQTITATEFITDTIVTTPTQQVQAVPQVNSLLLQQLLLQQQLQPHIEQPQLPIPILHTTASPLLLSDNLQEFDMNHIRLSNENDNDITFNEENTQNNKSGRKKSRKSSKTHKRKHQSFQDEAPESSSVITLYVSGRRPGEFSTILSTVPFGYDSTIHKRQAPGAQQHTAKIDTIHDFYVKDGSEYVPAYLLPEDDKPAQQFENNFLESAEYNLLDRQTQSLESIVGDVSTWIAKSTHTYGEAATFGKQLVFTKSLPSSGFPVAESTQLQLRTNATVHKPNQHFLV